MDITSRWEIFPDDLDATADFYVRVLGFDLVEDERASDHPYLSLRRGDARIGALERPAPDDAAGRRPPVGAELVLDDDDVEAERQRVLAADWPLADDLTHRPWGQTDFRVVDPSGYYLRITDRGART